MQELPTSLRNAHTSAMVLGVGLILLIAASSADAFVPSIGTCSVRIKPCEGSSYADAAAPIHRPTQRTVLKSKNVGNDEEQCHDGGVLLQSRRSALLRGAASLSVAGLGSASPLATPPAYAASTVASPTLNAAPSTDIVPNLQCLTDLPQLTPGCVRIYLCRHGQTENNRLHLVQGARIDPNLNGVGRSMATRMGMALSYLPEELAPRATVHSQLTRAKETALIASDTFGKVRNSRGRGDIDDPATLVQKWGMGDVEVPSGEQIDKLPTKVETLKSLGEVDFGAGYEGKSATEVKAGMTMTYGAWAMGVIDQRMDGEGESGRELLGRVANALHSLGEIAKESGGAVFAVSHSTYLRTLLGTVMDIPLAQAAQMEVKNGCINVLDINVEGAVNNLGPKSRVLGGGLSMAKDFRLTLPETNVIRVNEVRHMDGITWTS